jgi:hypothetical protein
MQNNLEQNYAAHQESANDRETAAENVNFTRELVAGAGEQELAAAKEFIAEAEIAYQKAEDKYKSIIAEGKAMGDMNTNPDLLKEAYREYSNFLIAERDKLDEKLAELSAKIDEEERLGNIRQEIPTVLAGKIEGWLKEYGGTRQHYENRAVRLYKIYSSDTSKPTPDQVLKTVEKAMNAELRADENIKIRTQPQFPDDFRKAR